MPELLKQEQIKEKRLQIGWKLKRLGNHPCLIVCKSSILHSSIIRGISVTSTVLSFEYNARPIGSTVSTAVVP